MSGNDGDHERLGWPLLLAGALSMTSLVAVGYIAGWLNATNGTAGSTPQFMGLVVAATLIGVPLLVVWSEGLPGVMPGA